MDWPALVNAFIEDLLGATGSFVLSGVDPQADGQAEPIARFSSALGEALRADGWTPPAGGQDDPELDAAVLRALDAGPGVASKEEDHAVVRAQARTAASGAHALWDLARAARAQGRRENGDAPAEPAEPGQERDPSVAVEQMRRAMASRATIEQAKGILMQKYSLNAESAWNYLVRMSQVRNVKLREIAFELTESTAARSSDEHPAPVTSDADRS